MTEEVFTLLPLQARAPAAQFDLWAPVWTLRWHFITWLWSVLSCHTSMSCRLSQCGDWWCFVLKYFSSVGRRPLQRWSFNCFMQRLSLQFWRCQYNLDLSAGYDELMKAGWSSWVYFCLTDKREANFSENTMRSFDLRPWLNSNESLTFDFDLIGDRLVSVLVEGLTLVLGRVFQPHGGDVEGEQWGGGGAVHMKLLPISFDHKGGGRGPVSTTGEGHSLPLQHLLAGIHGQRHHSRRICKKK